MKKLLSFIPLIIALAIFVGCAQVSFDVSFVSDGEIIHTISTNGKETIAIPANPTKDGYIFAGWYWDKDSWQKPFTAGSLLNEPLSADMSVYAKWIPTDVANQNYNVIFNSMGGPQVEGQSVKYGNPATEPTVGEREGFVLVGWYKEADYVTKWSFTTDKITSDITLYAKWVSTSDKEGSSIISLEGFTQNEKTFEADFDNSIKTVKIAELIKVSSNATYVVSTDIEGKDVIPSATVSLNVGENVFYILVTSGSGSSKTQYTVILNRKTPPTVTITLDTNGGKMSDSQKNELYVEIGKAIANLPRPTKAGNDFLGWFKNGDENERVTGQTIAEENMTLVALWQKAEPKNIAFSAFKVPTYSGEIFGTTSLGELYDGNLTARSVCPKNGEASIYFEAKSEEGAFVSQFKVVGVGKLAYILKATFIDNTEKEIGVGTVGAGNVFAINDTVKKIEIYFPISYDGYDALSEVIAYDIPKEEFVQGDTAYKYFNVPTISGPCYNGGGLALFDGEIGSNFEGVGVVHPTGEGPVTITITSKNKEGIYIEKLEIMGYGGTPYTLSITYADGSSKDVREGNFANNTFVIEGIVTQIEISVNTYEGEYYYFSEIIAK